MALHSSILQGDIHAIHNWAVADSAALIALSVVATDIGKVARQIDTSNYYVLKNNVGPVWALLTSPTPPVPKIIIPIAVSDETTAITAGVAKVTFRMPVALSLTAVRASLTVAQATGLIFTADVKQNGVSILSTLITIDNTEKTSTTAATLPVISTPAIADDAEITIDVTQIGDGTAKGLKVYLVGT